MIDWWLLGWIYLRVFVVFAVVYSTFALPLIERELVRKLNPNEERAITDARRHHRTP